MNVPAAKRSALLSLMFLTVYGGCNWITAHRADVGAWYFAWERRIPFVPLMIVPYLSIDMFFVAAPFLCRDRAELDLFARRVTVTILVAGAGFLTMPLRFAFERPMVHGWPGALFQAFGSLDRPFNLFPSLHIAFAAILVDNYWRHTKGTVRMALAIWFVLIGLSTVLTYQHHVIDVGGALVLTAAVFYVVHEARAQRSSVRNVRVACQYLLGAVIAAGVAVASWPWGALLLWPAVALATGGSAYMGMGPGVFRKTNGKIAVSAWFVLWPCLAGQWASLLYYRRRCGSCDQIAPGVLIGGRLSRRGAAEAIERGVTAVLDLTVEFSEVGPFRRVTYRNIQIVDLTAPTIEQLKDAAAFIIEQSTRGVVYVHCKIGYSRSVAAVGAYLLAAGRARTADEAIATIRRARPSIVVRPEAAAALRRFQATLTPRLVRHDPPPPRLRRVRRSSPMSCGQRTKVDARQSTPCAIVSMVLAAVARLICGTPPQWIGCQPSTRQRIYFANHTSHLDFLVLWASLPPEVRARTRPVAGRDYWDRNRIRRYLAGRVFRAVLVDRRDSSSTARGGLLDANRHAVISAARRNVEETANAMGTGHSLIMFPEGTRTTGPDVGPFKSGIYYLCRRRPDVELVPVYLENLNRILPKGEAVPVPLAGSVTFGQPMRLEPGEGKDAFLARARRALVMVHRPCTCLSTAISSAS